MKVAFDPSNIKPGFSGRNDVLIEDYAIMDMVAGGDHVQVTTGLPYSVPDKNPCVYDSNDQMFDQMWDMYVSIGQQEYVSPNVGAQFSAYRPCTVLQPPTAPLKPTTGALNHLLLDSNMTDVLAVDPGKGIVKALLDAGQVSVTLAYTSKEFPKEEIRDTLAYAKQDGLKFKFLPGGHELAIMVYDGYESTVPYHSELLRTVDRSGLGSSSVYLGSSGYMVNRFEKARGYEVNPYHVGAHRFIDNALEQERGVVQYALRSGGPMKRFYLFPTFYRYLPQQLHRYHRFVKASGKEMSSFFVDFSEPLATASRLPPPPMKVYTSDVRFIVVHGQFNGVSDGPGLLRETMTHVLDVPGYDLFYSRMWRIKQQAEEFGKQSPRLLMTFAEAVHVHSEEGGKIWVVSSNHVDPTIVEVGSGTYCMYWTDNPIRGAFSRRCGMRWSVLTKEEHISTPTGSLVGIPCVSLVAGSQYDLHRVKFPVWTHIPGEFAGDAHVDPVRYLTCEAPYVSGARKPIKFYFERSEYCDDSCMRYHIAPNGDVHEFCCQHHSVNPVFMFDSLYVPIDYDQFSAVPWQDEFVSDYYENEQPMAPLGYEDGYQQD